MSILYQKDGKIYNYTEGFNHDNYITFNPTPEQLQEWGYEEYIPEQIETDETILNLKNQIKDLEKQIASTDYILFKSMEGYDCDVLYPNWKQNRRQLREQINQLEKELVNYIPKN